MDTYRIIEDLRSYLIKSETNRVKNLTDKIIEENCRINHQPSDGFVYMGDYFKKSDLGLGKPQFISLHPDLYDRAGLIYKANERIERETRKICQALQTMIGECTSFDQIRNCLPDSLAALVPVVQKLPRTEPMEAVLTPRALKAYGKVSVTIDVYMATHLIF